MPSVKKLIVVGKPSYCLAFAEVASPSFTCVMVDSTSDDFVLRTNWPILKKKLNHRETAYFGFIAFPSGFVKENTITISEFKEYLEGDGLVIKKYLCLPSKLAKFVDNKLLTYKYLSSFPKIKANIPDFHDLISSKVPWGKMLPAVFRGFYESGGRGNKFIRNRSDLVNLPSTNGFLTSFISGIEVTQTVIVLGSKILYLPQTWKSLTDYMLTHSDQKPKFAGIIRGQLETIELANQIVRAFGTENNFILSIQVVVSTEQGLIDCKLLEVESRITGSTPIMEAVTGISVYEVLTDWLIGRDLGNKIKKVENRVACQYITLSPLTKKLKASYITGIKAEYIETLQSERYRISFCSPDIATLLKNANEIAHNINDDNFGVTIKKHLDEISHYVRYPFL